MAKIKNAFISLITIGCFLLPAMPVFGHYKDTPRTESHTRAIKINKFEDPKYLDEMKNKYLKRVNYETFSKNLNSGVTKQKFDGQEEFIETVIRKINYHPHITLKYGFNFNRGEDIEEFAEFIFDGVLKQKLDYEIKTPMDVLECINIALEYLVRYNNKMILTYEGGLGSDVNNDGRFDGISWNILKNIEWSLKKTIIEDPKKAEEITEKAKKQTDGTATDTLLMRGEGIPDAVEFVCRNYTSALEVMFETAKIRYPELTKGVELLQMSMPSHVFGAFVNKKTLEYIEIDPTHHDSMAGYLELLGIKNFVWPKEADEKYNLHYDCLQDKIFFQTDELHRIFINWGKAYNEETEIAKKEEEATGKIIEPIHDGSKKILDTLVPKIQKLVDKYPDSKKLAQHEIFAYWALLDHKEFSKAYEGFKNIYDNKKRKEGLNSDYHSYLILALGYSAFELKNYEEAIKYFQECFKFRVIDNSLVDDAMLSIAESHLKLKNYYKALFRAKDVLELCPEHYEELMKEAKGIAKKAEKKLWNYEKRNILSEYIKGDYEKAVQKLKGKEDSESRLLLAESHASLGNYDKAKSLYEKLMKEEDKNIADLAETELNQMNRKFLLYGYMNHFEGRHDKAIDALEFLKPRITPKDDVAERTSLHLMGSYMEKMKRQKTPEGMIDFFDKSFEEGTYFLKMFPKSRFAEYVKGDMKELKEFKERFEKAKKDTEK